MATSPFVQDVERTAIALAYRPEGLIADRVLPRVPVGKKQFTYTVFDQKSLTSIPNTAVGRLSAPNRVELGSVDIPVTVKDYGLSSVVINDEEGNAPANNKPSDAAVLALTDLIALDREQRVAREVFPGDADGRSASYGSNVDTPATEWSTPASSDPIGDLLKARDLCLSQPNKLVLGKQVWATLATHPRVVSAIRGITEDGVATKEQLAALLDIEEILIGRSWKDAARKGHAVNRAWLWGKHAAFLCVSANPSVRGGSASYGLTGEHQSRRVMSREVTVGLNGGVEYLVGEEVAELITAPALVSLLYDVIA